MELPADQSSDAVHAAKQSLLESVEPIAADEVPALAVRAQYDGYRDEVQSADSTTETYAAVQVRIPTERWEGVIIRVQTGKAMSRKLTEIRIGFRPDHHGAGESSQTNSEGDGEANQLIFRIQPDEGIELLLNAKKPGFADELQTVVMDWSYSQAGHPDAYERVLVDAARGDHTLFTTSAEVIAAWRIVENVLHAWTVSDDGLLRYPKGSASVG
jgi:glucose-6-phosphate 1-dehydrogenase